MDQLGPHNDYKTVSGEAFAEIDEKKSRFIGHIRPIDTVEQATRYIQKITDTYPDANHHAYAYIVRDHNQVHQRYSDDGEPKGTAGLPILDVLKGNGLMNTILIVTRYFGGTLLGTGGLVRAYGKCAGQALNSSHIVKKAYGICLTMELAYALLGKIQYLLEQENIKTLAMDYGARVIISIGVTMKQKDTIKKKLINVTNGQMTIKENKPIYIEMED